MKPDVIAQLCNKPEAIAERLIHLKTVFPSANVEAMALKNTDLLLVKSADNISSAAAELRAFLPPQVDIDRSVSDDLLEIRSYPYPVACQHRSPIDKSTKVHQDAIWKIAIWKRHIPGVL